MTRADQAALKAYPNVEQPVWDESYPKTLFVRHTERDAFIKGYERAEKDLGWHSVDECLPEIDEEVIVLTDEIGVAPMYKIGFGHIVKEVAVDIDGKPYKPISHNGWNMQGVRYWMPCPKIPEE